MEAADPVVAVAEDVQNLLTDAGHDVHVEDDVDRVGDFDADFGERRADRTHGIRDDVHRAALIRAAGDVVEALIHFLRIAPVVRRTGGFLVGCADKRPVFDTGDVVRTRPMQIAARKLFFVELDHFAGFNGFFAERVKLLFAAVNPDDLVGVHEGFDLVQPLQDGFVVGHIPTHLSAVNLADS